MAPSTSKQLRCTVCNLPLHLLSTHTACSYWNAACCCSGPVLLLQHLLVLLTRCFALPHTAAYKLLLLTDVDYLNISHYIVSTKIDTTAIPSRKYPFSSDQGSQAGLGSASTRLSHRPETLSAMVPFAAVYSIQMMYVCLCILLCCAAHK